MTAPPLTHGQKFAHDELVSLIEYFVASGCRFVGCLEQAAEPAANTVSFRYDIHHRDIDCGFGFLRAHRETGVPATFFLMHEYSEHEKRHDKDFASFADAVLESAHPGISIGLHDSPVDRYLLSTYAQQRESVYGAWLQSEQALAFFNQLARSATEAASFREGVVQLFVETVRRTRARFGTLELMSSHGGRLSQILRPKVSGMGAVGQLIANLFSENFVDDALLDLVSLKADVERYKGRISNWAHTSEGGGKIISMVEYIRRFLRQGNALNLLIHPAVWGRDSRDSEWSILLNGNPAQRTTTMPNGYSVQHGLRASGASTAVSVNPSTLRAELAKRELPAAIENAILIEPIAQGTVLPTGVRGAVTLAQHFQEHGDRGGQTDYFFGRSLERYGSLVAKALRTAIAGGPGSAAAVASEPSVALGHWLRDGFSGGSVARSRDIPLTPGELQYFFFSSSARALLVAQTLRELLRSGEIDCFIDHGAAIGFVPLVVSSLISVRSVACSEIKKEYVSAGRSLWGSLGMGNRIQYQQCSSVEFAYPPEGASVVFLGQMLFRIPPERRKAVLRAAIDALTPGGVLIINEIMDRPELGTTYRAEMVSSADLLDYIAGPHPIYVARGSSDSSNPIPISSASADGFKNSNNLVVLVKR